MNKKDFTAILQVALWHNDGMSELQIRQKLVDFGSNEVITRGIRICNKLNSIELEQNIK